MFRMCGYSKMMQSMISALIQMIVLIKLNHNISHSCAIILSVTFVSTIIVVLVTLFEINFQAYNAKKGNNTDDDNIIKESEMTSTVVRIDDNVINPNELSRISINEEVINPIATSRI